MAVLDFFVDSPGNKKRREAELAANKALMETQTAQQLKLRQDAENRSLMEESHKNFDTRRALAQMFPGADTEKKAAELQLAVPAERASSAMRLVNQNNAAAPFDPAIGVTGAEANIAGNNLATQRAGNETTRLQGAAPFEGEVGKTNANAAIAGNLGSQAGGLLKLAVDTFRQATAPQAAAKIDAADLAKASEQAAMATVEGSPQVINQRADTNSAIRSADAAKARFTSALSSKLSPDLAANAENLKATEAGVKSVYDINHPENWRRPTTEAELMLQMLQSKGLLGQQGAFPPGQNNFKPSSAISLNPGNQGYPQDTNVIGKLRRPGQ